MTAQALKSHLPCPCGKSSNAYAIYPENGYCWSCAKSFPLNEKEEENLEIAPDKPENYTKQIVPYRGRGVDTLKKYAVSVLVSPDGAPFAAEYNYPTHRKYRDLVNKRFWIEGAHAPGLFAVDRFSAGESKSCTIVEGEEDALATYEMLGKKYPVYSVQSASSAVKDITASKSILDSYDRVYLCFDNDSPGHRATELAAALFPYNKIYYVKLGKFKDPDEYFQNKEAAEFRNLWFNSKRYDPENIISSFSALEEIFKKPKKHAIASYPFKGLQAATYGIRTGETVLFKALEGIGKTEVIGAIENHVVVQHNVPIGIIHLEEDIQRTVCRFVSYKVGEPVHIEELTDLTNSDILSHFKEIVKGKDNVVSFYKQGKNDDSPDSFLAAIRFMVASAGCKIVFFDHISRLASMFKTDDERKMLDFISTQLSIMAEELDFALIEISHVNDDGLTRGSRNISKEAHIVISLHRDKTNPDKHVRNRTDMIIEKNRPVSITGPIAPLWFDEKTFCLSDEAPLPTDLPPVSTI